MSVSPQEENREDVILLATVYSQSEAAIIEATLTAYDIPYFCQGKAFSSLNIGTPQDLGGVRFYVPESVAEDAKALLAGSEEAG